MSDKTKVIFRKWRNAPYGVIAFFPEIPHDRQGHYMMSYERVGQHGGASYHLALPHTVPARPDEYAPLAAELTAIGYDLIPVKRETPAMRAARYAATERE